MKNNHRVNRREALRVGALSALGLTLSDYLRLRAADEQAKSSADAVIFIHLQGGPAHLDTLDMKPEAPAEERGEFKPIQTKIPGLTACEHLPKFAQTADRYTLIRGISHSAGAHPQANQYLFSGNPVSPAVVHPAIGCVAALERPSRPDLPGFVAIPNTDMSAGYLGVANGPYKTSAIPQSGKPFEVRGLTLADGLTIDKVKSRDQLLKDLDTRFRQADVNSPVLKGLDKFAEQAQRIVTSAHAREAFDVAKEPPAIAKLFAANDLGQSCLLAARLVEFGVRFVSIFDGAWDTHLDNFNSLKNKLLPPLDAALPAMVEALRAKRLLERTLVVVTGEFGRTPTINKNAGRDHWPRAMWTLMAGGGVKPGQLVGGTDKKGHGPDSDTKLKMDDLAATILYALGLDHKKEYETQTGRPVYLVPNGRPIMSVFGM